MMCRLHFAPARPQAGAKRKQERDPMVFAVQCPNPKCRKYMLVEDHEVNKIVSCLLCKTAIKVGGGTKSKDPGEKNDQVKVTNDDRAK